jgi:hypothetical protein
MKYTIRKWEGDDIYSYAVFRADDVKGTGSGVYFGNAKPLVCGCSRQEANYYKERLMKEQKVEVNQLPPNESYQ